MLIQTEKNIAIAHLVQTADSQSPCKRLHGHNLRVVVTINGEIANDGMVLDFRYVKGIIDRLDHKTIIPDSLVVSEEDNMLYIETGYSKLALPTTDVIALNLPAITAENLAIYFVSEIKKIIEEDDYVSVRIFESEKSFAEVDSDDII
jgi:6-pyruvoyl tetrahydropterin synthase/QueD family protein